MTRTRRMRRQSRCSPSSRSVVRRVSTMEKSPSSISRWRVVSAWLRQTGLDHRTIVVIAGDHGGALGSHGEGTHGFFIYDWAMHVPFIVATPFDDLQGVRVDSQVSLVDVFPTVLALAGIDAKAKGPWPFICCP